MLPALGRLWEMQPCRLLVTTSVGVVQEATVSLQLHLKSDAGLADVLLGDRVSDLLQHPSVLRLLLTAVPLLDPSQQTRCYAALAGKPVMTQRGHPHMLPFLALQLARS